MMIKIKNLITICIVFSTFINANSQILDSAYLRCSYQFDWVKDSTKLDNRKNELMILEIGKQISCFYCYKTYLVDSLLNVDVGKGATAQEIVANLKKYGTKGITYDILQSSSDNRLVFVENFGRKNFKYQQPLKLQDWIILSDTSNIIGYRVQKAECNYGGRKWIVWFAPDIPVSYGPWKLNGLPGLILAANDEKKYFQFTFKGIEYLKTKNPIRLPHFGKRVYTNVTKNELLKLEYKRYTDPIGFLNENIDANASAPVNSSEDIQRQIYVYTPIELY